MSVLLLAAEPSSLTWPDTVGLIAVLAFFAFIGWLGAR